MTDQLTMGLVVTATDSGLSCGKCGESLQNTGSVGVADPPGRHVLHPWAGPGTQTRRCTACNTTNIGVGPTNLANPALLLPLGTRYVSTAEASGAPLSSVGAARAPRSAPMAAAAGVFTALGLLFYTIALLIGIHNPWGAIGGGISGLFHAGWVSLLIGTILWLILVFRFASRFDAIHDKVVG